MKIAIYGGSFNPPHAGHVAAAETIARTVAPDKLLIIPDYLPPHKVMEEGSPTAKMRADMCRLAFADVQGAEVTELEIDRGGKSYTSDTIEYLRTIYPDDELMLVIGSDMLLTFTEWHRFKYLLEQCTLLVLSRFGNDISELDGYAERLRLVYGADVRIIEHKPVVINSSMLRELIRAGLSDPAVPPAVAEYIAGHNLYK